MPRDDERTRAQQLLLTALGATPGTGLTEAALRNVTGLGLSLFHEALPVLLEAGRVVVSQGNGRQHQTLYHLVLVQLDCGAQEGPLSPLAGAVLSGLERRAEGARALAKRLNLTVPPVQGALEELEAFGWVYRSQVGLLVIYRVKNPGDTGSG